MVSLSTNAAMIEDEITQILDLVIEQVENLPGNGDFPLIYNEIKKIAKGHLRRHKTGTTLTPTVLVHEAYLKLTNNSGQWQSEKHFYRTASKAIRQIIIDCARRKQAIKRGVNENDVESLAHQLHERPEQQILRLDEALKTLEMENSYLAELVELRFFSGFTGEETADILGCSRRKVQQDWNLAKELLKQYIQDI